MFRPRQREAPTEAFRPARDERGAAGAAATEVFRKPAGPGGHAAPESPGRYGGQGGEGGATPQPAGPTGGAGGGSHRLRTGIIIGVVFLIVLLAVGDRVAARVAASQIVKEIQKSQQLPTKPKATVGGVPFITQVLFGKYDDLGVTINRISTPGPCVDQINAHLKGVHVPLSKGISGKIDKVPVDTVTGTARITYPDLNRYLANQPGKLVFEPTSKGAANVTAEVATPIGEQRGGATVKLGVADHQLSITIVGVSALGINLPVPSITVPVPVPLSGLPFNLKLTKADTGANGVELGVSASNVTIKTPSGTSQGQPVKAC